ncbi:MAG TPA: hypothetical protein VGR89_09950 [Puia sp.]|nr:hypothetical protein [Puia sp.]
MILTRLVTGSILLLLALRWFEHATLSRLASPPLFHAEVDITYWLFKDSGLPVFLIRHQAAAVIFDLLMFSSGLIAFLRPFNRVAILVFAVLLFLYGLTFNLFATHHLAQVAGFMVVLWPFVLRDNKKFGLAWEGMRYFTCFIYFTAFVWKAVPGHSLYDLHQGTVTFKANLVDYLVQNPGGFITTVYRWCLRNPWLLDAGEKATVLLEGTMVIGFFTRKFDRYLIWVPVAIHVITYYFSDVFFIELLVVDLSLLSASQLERIGSIFNVSNAPGRQKKETSPR